MPEKKAKAKSRKTPTKNKGGRPRFKLNYTTLKELCGWQCTGEECAAALGCDYDTLNNNLKNDYQEQCAKNDGVAPHGYADGFSDYYRQFSLAGKVSLRAAQFKSAINQKNPTMLKFLGKNYLDQIDAKQMTHSLAELQNAPTEFLMDRLKELEGKQ